MAWRKKSKRKADPMEPLTTGIKLTRSGQRSHKGTVDLAARDTVMQRRSREAGIPIKPDTRADLADPMRGCHAGRWIIANAKLVDGTPDMPLRADMWRAVMHFAEVEMRYAIAIGLPPRHAKGMDMSAATPGEARTGIAVSDDDRALAAKRALAWVHDVLNPLSLVMLQRVVLDDEPVRMPVQFRAQLLRIVALMRGGNGKGRRRN